MTIAHPVRVLLVDDQVLLRDSLATVLGADPRIEVIAGVGDGAAAVEAVRAHRIDVALMDIRMPGLDGIRATEQIVLMAPDTRVLILTTFDLDEFVLGAVKAGASGYLTKDTPPGRLIEAICDVAAGSSALAPGVTGSVLEYLRRAPVPDRSAIAVLTARETDVFTQLAAGRSNVEIGRELHLTENTVKTHVRAVLGKLCLRDRVHAVIFAYEHGLAGSHPSG